MWVISHDIRVFKGDGGGLAEGVVGDSHRAGTLPPTVVGLAGTGMEGMNHRIGDGENVEGPTLFWPLQQ